MKRCPVCATLLSRRKIGDVEIDGCSGCGGIWLDDGELAAFARAPDLLHRAADSVRATQTPIAPSRSGACPKDGAGLRPFEWPRFPGLKLDSCPTCRGVWFDSGELKALANTAAPAATRTAPAPAPVWGAGAIEAQADGGLRTADPTSTAGLPVVRGIALRSMHVETGFFGSLSRGWRFVSGAYALAFQQTSLLLPIVYGTLTGLVLSLGMLGMLFLYWSSTGGAASPDVEAWAKTHQPVLVVAGSAWALGSHFLSYFFMGMTVSMVDAWLKGREPKIGIAFRDSLKNVGGILALAVVDTLVNVLTSALRGNRRRRNLIGSMIADAIQAAWTVLSFLLLPVIMIEDIGLLPALSRVRDIHSRNLMQIAVGEVGIRMVTGLMGLAFAGVLFLGALVLFPLGKMGIVPWVLALVVGITILGVLNTFARATYYTCLYLWAVEIERAPDPGRVLVPGPLASVLS